MKKIGILFGQEYSFPPAFVERVNQKTGGKDIRAEFVKIDKVIKASRAATMWSSIASRRTCRSIGPGSKTKRSQAARL